MRSSSQLSAALLVRERMGPFPLAIAAPRKDMAIKDHQESAHLAGSTKTKLQPLPVHRLFQSLPSLVRAALTLLPMPIPCLKCMALGESS